MKTKIRIKCMTCFYEVEVSAPTFFEQSARTGALRARDYHKKCSGHSVFSETTEEIKP